MSGFARDAVPEGAGAGGAADGGSGTRERSPDDARDELAPTPLAQPGPEVLLVPWRRAPFPIDWEGAFAGSGAAAGGAGGAGGGAARRPAESALHLEVGFGDGRFTARRARARPDERFVGLEVSNVSVQRALARLRREGIRNVRLVKIGAEFALAHLFEAASLRSVVVNFPDPWPKERHAEHRFLRPHGFDLLAARLVPGGEVRLATDHRDYLDFARGAARADGRFELVDAEPPEAVFETKYALKWKGQGKPLYYQVFRLARPPADAARAHPPLERPDRMPHAFLSGEFRADAPFAKQVLAYGEGHVIVHEALRAVGDAERWLFRVTVDEPDLVQQVLVVAQRRAGGEVIVRLERFGDPVVTPTARGAVHAVAEWLRSTTPLEVVARNY